jgi:uncharacterized protein
VGSQSRWTTQGGFFGPETSFTNKTLKGCLSVNLTESAIVVLAGVGAGTLNTVVGSGTLLTFPILVGLGVPPVQANVANNIGLASGSVSGAIGYRAELSGPPSRIINCCLASAFGGITGATLLLVLPAGIFEALVPVLLSAAVVLVAVQPWISRALKKREFVTLHGDGWILTSATFLTSVYGGYFGAGQGVILLAVMNMLVTGPMQQVNALKNVLQGVDNTLSACVFILITEVRWSLVLLLMVGAVLGGQIGARFGRKIPERWFRGLVILVGAAGLIHWFY